jgi:hypothetical protein
VFCAVAKQILGALRTGWRNRRNHDREIRISSVQLTNQWGRSLYFPDRNRMHPNGGSWHRQARKTKSFPEAIKIGTVKKTTPQKKNDDEWRYQV